MNWFVKEQNHEIQKLPQLSLCRVDEIVPKRILSDQRQLFQHLKEM